MLIISTLFFLFQQSWVQSLSPIPIALTPNKRFMNKVFLACLILSGTIFLWKSVRCGERASQGTLRSSFYHLYFLQSSPAFNLYDMFNFFPKLYLNESNHDLKHLETLTSEQLFHFWYILMSQEGKRFTQDLIISSSSGALGCCSGVLQMLPLALKKTMWTRQCKRSMKEWLSYFNGQSSSALRTLICM